MGLLLFPSRWTVLQLPLQVPRTEHACRWVLDRVLIAFRWSTCRSNALKSTSMSTVGRSWHSSPSRLSSGSIAASEFSHRRERSTLTTHLQHLESGGLDSYCSCAKNKGELRRNPRSTKQKLLWHCKSVTPTFVVRCTRSGSAGRSFQRAVSHEASSVSWQCEITRTWFY